MAKKTVASLHEGSKEGREWRYYRLAKLPPNLQKYASPSLLANI